MGIQFRLIRLVSRSQRQIRLGEPDRNSIVRQAESDTAAAGELGPSQLQ